FSYPMYGLSGVTVDGDDSAYSRQRSTFAWRPSTQRSASSVEAFASSRIDSSRLRASTGSITLSSKSPWEPANAIAASLPITCAHTWRTDSQMTGFTLPGMIDEPGCRWGRASAPGPVRGPEPVHRMTLAIL